MNFEVRCLASANASLVLCRRIGVSFSAPRPKWALRTPCRNSKSGNCLSLRFTVYELTKKAAAKENARMETKRRKTKT